MVQKVTCNRPAAREREREVSVRNVYIPIILVVGFQPNEGVLHYGSPVLEVGVPGSQLHPLSDNSGQVDNSVQKDGCKLRYCLRKVHHMTTVAKLVPFDPVHAYHRSNTSDELLLEVRQAGQLGRHSARGSILLSAAN